MSDLRHWFGLIAVLALIAGCETIVEVDAPPHDPKIVAHGFFGADSLWMVQVSTSVAHTSRSDPTLVTDAQVEILQHGERVQFLAPADSGLYTAHGLRSDSASSYTLRVSVPGYESVEGSDRLPREAQVVSFADTSVTDANGLRAVELRLEIDDPGSEKNYYGLFVVQGAARVDAAAGSVQPIPPTLKTYESDDPVLESVLSEYLDPEMRQYRTAFFNDETFDGVRKAIDFRLTYRPPDMAEQVQTLRTFAVVLLSASEHLYRYWSTADRQLAGNENPFAEPVRVHSNMSNELGIFAGFRYRALPVGPPRQDVQAACERLNLTGVDCTQIVTLLPNRLRDLFLGGLLTH